MREHTLIQKYKIEGFLNAFRINRDSYINEPHISKLLDNISPAQMEQEIQSRIIKMTRENKDLMLNETGVQTSPTDEDVKKYLHEVLTEINKIKMTTNDKHQNE